MRRVRSIKRRGWGLKAKGGGRARERRKTRPGYVYVNCCLNEGFVARFCLRLRSPPPVLFKSEITVPLLFPLLAPTPRTQRCNSSSFSTTLPLLVTSGLGRAQPPTSQLLCLWCLSPHPLSTVWGRAQHVTSTDHPPLSVLQILEPSPSDV